MENFLKDFNIFFDYIFNAIKIVFNWLFTDNILGEILLFIILISLFIYILFLISNLKKS